MRLHLASTLAALVLAQGPAEAQWMPNGIPVGSTGQLQLQGESLVASDGKGGLFVAWREERINTTTVEDIYLQHVLSHGQIDPLWPPSGLPVVIEEHIQSPTHLLGDGAGGAIVVWLDTRNGSNDVFALRVGSSGQLAQGWTEEGNAVCVASGNQVFTTACADGNGGAFIAWDDYRDGTMRARMTHVLHDGTIAPGWGDSGKLITDDAGFSGVRVVLDEPDGCLVVWGDSRGQTALGVNMYAIRLTDTGESYPGWPVGGTPLLTLGTSAGVRRGVSDGNGGAFIGWNDNRVGVPESNPFYYDIYAQHVRGDGSLDPLWSADGNAVCNAPDGQFEFGMVPDGSGGALYLWEDFRQGFWQMYGGRLTSAGTVASGWPVNGKPVVSSTVTKFQPKIVEDNGGGFFGFWVEYPPKQSGPIVGQHVLGDGTLAWGSAGMPIAVPPVDGSVDDPAVASDGQGGVLMSYERFDPEPWQRIYALRIAADGPVPTVLSLVDYEVGPGRVRLRWQASGAGNMITAVERSVEGEFWQDVGRPRLEGRELLVYEDGSAEPGRFAYRLRYDEGLGTEFSEAVWVDVPSTHAFSLEGFRPNPALRNATIAFSLPDAAPATLQVYDVAGRRVFSQDVGPLGPGVHIMRLGAQSELGVGVYWLRLIRRDSKLTVKGLVTR